MHAFATHAEAIGLDSLWVCDHFLSGPAGRPTEAIHEAWTSVAALAASANRIKLGQLVMCVSFRSPSRDSTVRQQGVCRVRSHTIRRRNIR